jgi:hypothetical protein
MDQWRQQSFVLHAHGQNGVLSHINIKSPSTLKMPYGTAACDGEQAKP